MLILSQLFSNIIPCGISDKSVTSLEKEMDKLEMEEIQEKVKNHLQELFEMTLV